MHRFGDGYRIKLRMKEVRGNDSMKEFMRQNFPEATLNVSKAVGKVGVVTNVFIGGALQHYGISDTVFGCQTCPGVQIIRRHKGFTRH